MKKIKLEFEEVILWVSDDRILSATKNCLKEVNKEISLKLPRSNSRRSIKNFLLVRGW